MNYRINIALTTGKGWDGKPVYAHFFATADHSITDLTQLARVYTVLAAKFPVSEGYRLEVTQWQTTGQGVEGYPLPHVHSD